LISILVIKLGREERLTAVVTTVQGQLVMVRVVGAGTVMVWSFTVRTVAYGQ
jgi:hypothetical protein